MPKRQNVRRIDSLEVQGDDSWVEIVSPKIEEVKAQQASMQPIRDELATIELELKKEGLTQAEINSNPRYAAVNQRLSDEGTKLMAAYVKDWNWVDDDGEPLPKPAGNEKAFGQLTVGELTWLSNNFRAIAPDVKKS